MGKMDGSYFMGGYSVILVNGIPDTYFEFRKGVCQGDPLSPYLFLLVVGLHKILSRGINLGHFEDLIPHIINIHKVLNLQLGPFNERVRASWH
jgi:hypothetical protein